MATQPSWTGSYEDIPIGAEESFTRTVDYAAIDGFAQAIRACYRRRT